ncbi:unnamed protein product [Brachionus calyciflorus]|uniref:Uncharacterized protein n=1 Tax=Brachionus calyciflorus TaxID=104777 RepID=A0A814MW06_9BILA|nr:unnamed protein product [Brachionus calyciflorus]
MVNDRIESKETKQTNRSILIHIAKNLKDRVPINACSSYTVSSGGKRHEKEGKNWPAGIANSGDAEQDIDTIEVDGKNGKDQLDDLQDLTN